MSVQISELLYSSPDIRKGRACVVGTRTTVHRIAVWWKMGESAEEIARKFPHLSLAGVHAALAYYHANRAEVDAEIAADQAEEDRIEAEHCGTGSVSDLNLGKRPFDQSSGRLRSPYRSLAEQ